MKLIVWMTREIFNMLNQYTVDSPTFPVNQRFSPPFPDPGGILSRSLGMPSRNDRPPSIWDTHGKSGNVFSNPTASSSTPFPQGINPWISNVSEHASPHVMSESQTPKTALDPRCQSGPSARNSFNPSEGRVAKSCGADQQRLQISDLHFDKFPNPATFACWKIRFKIEVCTCSQFSTEAVLWIKEVEMVESVDDLKSSCSIRGTQGPDFEVLDAKIASALTRIIHDTHFKKKISLEDMKAQKEDRFLRGRQIAYLIYEYFRVTGANDSVENYADLFIIVLRNDDIQIRFEMGPNSFINDANPIWWHLGRIVQIKHTRVWETQDRIGIVQCGDSSEESWTWLSQIEDNGKKKYRAEFTNEQFWRQKRKLWKKRPGQEPGDKTAWTKEV